MINNFELELRGDKIRIARHSIGSQVIFRISFSNNKVPLVITRAEHSNSGKFWTSIPEGGQKEAEEIGTLITEYYKTFQ